MSLQVLVPVAGQAGFFYPKKQNQMKLNQTIRGISRLLGLFALLIFSPFPVLSQKSAKAGKLSKTTVTKTSEVDDEVAEFEQSLKKRKRRKIVVEEEDFITSEEDDYTPTPPLPRKLTVEELRDYAMAFVPGGTFMMGCDPLKDPNCFEDEIPAREQTVADFHIGRHEVTGRVWRSVMEGHPEVMGVAYCDECPVVEVSLEEVQIFIAQLNKMTGKQFRLPTEAEWEFAAMGGNESKGYIYSGSNNVSETVWYERNTGMALQPVGTKLPNELGIYDMSGNVWEWCADQYRPFRTSAENSASSDSIIRHVLRGGSSDDSARVCRVKSRVGYPADFSSHTLGFRLAISK